MHILTECPALTSSIKDLFDNVAAQNILNFIKNPIFIALYNVITTYFILSQSLEHFYLIIIIICYVIFTAFNISHFQHSTSNERIVLMCR